MSDAKLGLLAVMIGTGLDLDSGASLFDLHDLENEARERALEQTLLSYGGVQQMPYLQKVQWLAMADVNPAGGLNLCYRQGQEIDLLQALGDAIQNRQVVFWNAWERDVARNRAAVLGAVSLNETGVLLSESLGLQAEHDEDRHRELLGRLLGMEVEDDLVQQCLAQVASMACLQSRMQEGQSLGGAALLGCQTEELKAAIAAADVIRV